MQAASDISQHYPGEQQLNLRPYIDIIVRRRRIVISITLLTIIVVGLFIAVSPPPYAAVAGVAIVKAKSDISFDTNFKTISAEDLAAGGSSKALDADARRTALVGLVENSAIAQTVIAAEGNRLPSALRDPSTLLDRVNSIAEKDGDLISITVTDPDPVLAAELANAWASAYEHLINTLYSTSSPQISSSVDSEVIRTQKVQQDAQVALERFIANNQIQDLNRQIAEKQTVIDLLSKGKETAVATVIDEQLKAQQQLINAYYSSQSASKLLAFNKQQDAKRTMLGEFIDSEINARMAAFRRDRQIRQQLFDKYVSAEIGGKLAVVDQQVSEKTSKLADYYAQKMRFSRLLDNANTMRAQVQQGGNAAAASNTLALLLLKSNASAPGDNLPANLQLQIPAETPATAAQQLVDIDAIISTLGQRLKDIDGKIDTASKELLAGTGYNFLDQISSTPLTLTTPAISGTTTTAISGTNTTLSAAITEKYRELFVVGPQAKAAESVAVNTDLFAQIKKLYPDLFTVDEIMQLAESVPVDNPLAAAAQERSKDLLQLKELEDLPNFSVSSAPLVAAIDKLQADIRTLAVQKEQEETKQNQLTQQRDLAREASTTLARKQTEVGIASVVTGSEVRLAAPATPPVHRSMSRALILIAAVIVGLMIGLLTVWLAQLFGPQVIVGTPSLPWNRLLRWVMTPLSGLPPYTPQGE